MCLIELYKATYSFQILFKLGTKITTCVLFFADFPYEKFHPRRGVSLYTGNSDILDITFCTH